MHMCVHACLGEPPMCECSTLIPTFPSQGLMLALNTGLMLEKKAVLKRFILSQATGVGNLRLHPGTPVQGPGRVQS